MNYLIISVNHSSVPLADREHLAVATGEARAVVERIVEAGKGRLPEALLLSTCNRLELYCSLSSGDSDRELTARFRHLFGIEGPDWTERVRAFSGATAIRHAFRVASGLDSLVLGESEILGQMKDAVETARMAGTLGRGLEQLFQRAFRVSRAIRRETSVGRSSISMASAAVRLAEGALPRLSDSRILFVGAGAMSGLAVARFAALRPRELVVASRSAGRAALLAERYGARAIPISDLPNEAGSFDVIVSSTVAPVPGVYEHLRRTAGAALTVVIDLAVPRSVDPAAAALPFVRVFTLDDISALVSTGVAARRAASTAAEPIIAREVAQFTRWLESRKMVPALLQLDAWAERLRTAELERVRRALKNGASVDAALSQLAVRLSNKLLHPSRRLLGSGAVSTDAKRCVTEILSHSARH